MEWDWRVRTCFAVTVVPLNREGDLQAIEEHFSDRFGSGRVNATATEWTVGAESEQEGLRYKAEIDELINRDDLLLVARLQQRGGQAWLDADPGDDSAGEEEILELLESRQAIGGAFDEAFASAYAAVEPLHLTRAADDWSNAKAEVVIDAGTEAFELALRLTRGGTANIFDARGVHVPAQDEQSARALDREIRGALGDDTKTDVRPCEPPLR